MKILKIIDSLVLGDRTTLGAAPYVKDLLKSFPDGRVQQIFLEIVQGILVVLNDHGCQNLCAAAMQMCRFFTDNSNNVHGPAEAIALAKYFLAVPISIYAQGDLIGKVPFVERAPLPQGMKPFEPSGSFGRYYKRRLSLDCRRAKNLHLWWSWYQVKRNTPTVDESFVQACYDKHAKMLSRPDPSPSGFVSCNVTKGSGVIGFCFDPLDLVKNEIRACADSLSQCDPVERWSPQRTACYEQSTSRGGQLRKVSDYLCQRIGYDVDVEIGKNRELLRMEWFPYLRTRSYDTNVIVCTYVRPEAYYSIPQVSELSPEELMESEVARASVYGICEPLKVRIITKGPAVLYWRCKPFQKAIWKALKQFPHFRLIGRPIGACDLTALGQFLASVDYSAATDGSSQSVGLRILMDIFMQSSLDCNAFNCAKAAFASHQLEYPKTEYGQTAPVLQTNGQLMGSILSFVILCLLNLCTLRATERATGIKVIDPLINGDDMFYSVDDVEFWTTQCTIARAVGLEPSVGKCYLSEHCCSMNSVAFHRGQDGLLREVDYLPVGLLHGKHKVSNKDTTVGCNDTFELDVEQDTVASCFNLIVNGAQSPLKTAKRFLKYNRQKLIEELNGRNLFLPCWLGGYGQNPPLGFKVKVTNSQVEFAKRCRARYDTDVVRIVHRVGPLERSHERLENLDVRKDHWTLGVDTLGGRSGIRADETKAKFTNKVWLRRASTRQPVFCLQWLPWMNQDVLLRTPAASGYSSQIVQNGVHEALNTYVPSPLFTRRDVESNDWKDEPLVADSKTFDVVPNKTNRSAVMNSLGQHYPGSLKANAEIQKHQEEGREEAGRGSEDREQGRHPQNKQVEEADQPTKLDVSAALVREPYESGSWSSEGARSAWNADGSGVLIPN